MASAIRTWATPRSSAHRSISIEPARSPTSTRSATVKPVTSACPWWNRATASASMVPAEVGDQLGRGGRQLPQVGAHRLDQGRDGVGGDPTAGVADLVAHEADPVADRADLGALVDGGSGGLERLDQRLVALAAVVDEDQREIGVRVLRVAGQRVGESTPRTPGHRRPPRAGDRRTARARAPRPADRPAGPRPRARWSSPSGWRARTAERTADTARDRRSSSSPITTRRREVGSTGFRRHVRWCHGGATVPGGRERPCRDPGPPQVDRRPSRCRRRALLRRHAPGGRRCRRSARSPSRSVRWTSMPACLSHRRRRGAGCPYVLSAPTDTSASRGAGGREELLIGVVAAVVRHLEDVGAQVDAAAAEPGLGLRTEVAGEQDRQASGRPRGPPPTSRSGPLLPWRTPGPGRVPPGPRRRRCAGHQAPARQALATGPVDERGEPRHAVVGRRQGARRHRADVPTGQHSGHAADMVGVEVGGEHQRQGGDPQPVQAASTGPGRDRRRRGLPAPCPGGQHHRVALAHVAGDGQRSGGGQPGPPPRGQPSDHQPDQRRPGRAAGARDSARGSTPEQQQAASSTAPTAPEAIRSRRPGVRQPSPRPPPASRRASQRASTQSVGGHGQHRAPRGRADPARSPAPPRGRPARSPGRATRLTVPLRAATSGAVASPAAALTASASARTGRHPRVRRPRDQPGASSTRRRSPTTDSAKPGSTASPGSSRRSTHHRRGQRRNGGPRPPGGQRQQRHRPHRGRAHHARARAGQHDEGHEPQARDDGLDPPVRGPPAQRPQHAGEHDRDVGSGHGGEVAQSGPLELLGQDRVHRPGVADRQTR